MMVIVQRISSFFDLSHIVTFASWVVAWTGSVSVSLAPFLDPSLPPSLSFLCLRVFFLSLLPSVSLSLLSALVFALSSSSSSLLLPLNCLKIFNYLIDRVFAHNWTKPSEAKIFSIFVSFETPLDPKTLQRKTHC